jgi:hypothetical protein
MLSLFYQSKMLPVFPLEVSFIISYAVRLLQLIDIDEHIGATR